MMNITNFMNSKWENNNLRRKVFQIFLFFKQIIHKFLGIQMLHPGLLVSYRQQQKYQPSK